MPLIVLTTRIQAPAARVFDLARSIDLHQKSTEHTRERAIGGITTGLIGLDQQVTWEARHFGVLQRLTVRVTAFHQPAYFQTTMVQGAFKQMTHAHTFIAESNGTEMIDRLEFGSPLGPLGRLADWAILGCYMRRFLLQRNRQLKAVAESEDWRQYLDAAQPNTPSDSTL